MSTKVLPTIRLYRGWDDPGRYVWSPFVTKVEFRLRTSRISYVCASGSPKSGPRGKIPYMDLMESDGPTHSLSDSALILKDLVHLGVIQDLNAELNAAQSGQDLAIRALLEDKLSFYLSYERWIKNYYTMRDHVLWSIPYPMRVVIGVLAYRGNVTRFYHQGTGRYSDDEIRAFIREIFVGLNGLLEASRRKSKTGKCFWVLGGGEPSEADATMFGFVISVLVCTAGPESRKLVTDEFPVIVEYAERIHRQWFPDYEMWA